ncbi:hypothetical protein XM47_18395 [Catenovulum maritimum]|uniref:Beta-xylanase n=2 Tax=Catenovulum maritimum TaxID=1513271 RepID=A0A0J8GLK3_9ALTE|nr:hypothetical protein XM47_18395 [Catenovulum maritimum]
MKMNAIQPSQGNFTFADADALVNYAANNGMSVHGHVLVWHSQVPNWMQSFNGDKSQWIAMMEDHVYQVASHFSGKLASWDVVNEAFNEDGSYRSIAVDNGHGADQRQASIWHQNIGDEFIALAFKKAREADANVDLYYNDYNISWNEAKLDAIVNMAANFIDNNVPIDGIGFQMHINSNGPDKAHFAKQLKKVVDLGLKVKLTELDIQMNSSGDLDTFTPFVAEKQKQRYFDIVSTYLAVVPKNQRGGITVWGIGDADSWIQGLTGNTDWPLLFDDNFNPKPALQGFADALAADPRADEPNLEDNQDNTTTPAANLVTNSDFESGNTHNWFGHGPTSVEIESSEVNAGQYAAKASARTDSWNGIAHNINLTPGETYLVTAWIKLANAAADKASLSIKLTDDAGDHYNSAAYQVEVSNDNWTKLTGEYTHTVSGNDLGTYVYIEGPASGVDYYIDNISVVAK